MLQPDPKAIGEPDAGEGLHGVVGESLARFGGLPLLFLPQRTGRKPLSDSLIPTP
jgi:hypothetical protein